MDGGSMSGLQGSLGELLQFVHGVSRSSVKSNRSNILRLCLQQSRIEVGTTGIYRGLRRCVKKVEALQGILAAPPPNPDPLNPNG
jgi:hypothetical protein